MSVNQLNRSSASVMHRRRFIAEVGGLLAGGSLLGAVSACAGEVTGRGPMRSPSGPGFIRGTVVDATGLPQPVGRVYLLKKNGFNAGVYADVDAHGKFDFGNVDVGEYQVRFWGSNLASVPEPLQNPVPVRVAATETTTVQFTIVIGKAYEGTEQEIYIGEYYFQAQPVGEMNGTTTVRAGTLVCWYNVGGMVHDISGGPWGTSGPIPHGGNFMWKADAPGIFPYRCSYHGTQMLATLTVLA